MKGNVMNALSSQICPTLLRISHHLNRTGAKALIKTFKDLEKQGRKEKTCNSSKKEGTITI